MYLEKVVSQDILFYLLGERAVVLELSAPASLALQQRIWGLADYLNHQSMVREVVPGMNNLTVLLEEPQQSTSAAIDWLKTLWDKSEALLPEARDIDIPVCYGGDEGPDLNEVANYHGMTAKQVVECHCSANYVVYFLGFQPGFAYMGGMPKQLDTPRRADPRIAVAPGSVGIGGSQTGIYPLETPGGWQIIGRTSLKLFDPFAMPPTLLRPGDNVRFIPAKEGVC